MAKETTGRIETIHRGLALCREILQSALITILAIFAITAFAYPPWAHVQLSRLGIEIKEISVAGVKVVVDQSFALADALAEAELSLGNAREVLKASASTVDAARATVSVDAAIKRVATAQAALVVQERGTKKLQHKAGLQPELPDSAWITVGRLTEAKELQPAARIDASGTTIANGQVKQVTLKKDAMVHTSDECTRTDIADVRPVSPAETQKVVILLSAGAYEAIETHSCPSIGGGKMISARIAVTPARVRLARYSDAGI